MVLSNMVSNCVHNSKIKVRTVKLLALLVFGSGEKYKVD